MNTRRKILKGLASLPLAGCALGSSLAASPAVPVAQTSTTLALLTKWHKILEFKYNGEQDDYNDRDHCWPIEYGNAEPLAVSCVKELQAFEDQYLALKDSVPANEPDQCNKVHWYTVIAKNVIPWIRKRYSGNMHPLALCQYDLTPLRLDMHRVVPHVVPWQRKTITPFTMTYEESKGITEPDFFCCHVDGHPTLFEEHIFNNHSHVLLA